MLDVLLLSSFEEGDAFARANGLLFLEASAKTGDYVEESFVTAAINVLERLNNGLFRMDDEVNTSRTVYNRILLFVMIITLCKRYYQPTAILVFITYIVYSCKNTLLCKFS